MLLLVVVSQRSLFSNYGVCSELTDCPGRYIGESSSGDLHVGQRRKI